MKTLLAVALLAVAITSPLYAGEGMDTETVLKNNNGLTHSPVILERKAGGKQE